MVRQRQHQNEFTIEVYIAVEVADASAHVNRSI